MNAKSRMEAIEQRAEFVTESGCLIWMGCVQGNGYGRISLDGRSQYVHRAAFEAHYGYLPGDGDICHKCDTRCCCNPHHLFHGSRLDNMEDAVRKGRQARGERLSVLRQGEKTNLAKLTECKVLEIRKLLADGISVGQVASMHNVSADNIRRIKRRDTWRHI